MEHDGELRQAIAHVRRNTDGSWDEPQPLVDHLLGTATLARRFGEAFDSGDWAYAAGIGHDLGKSPEEWIDYLLRKSGFADEAHLETKHGKLDHSSPGARIVEDLYGKGVGRILAYCIAGHHAGLADWLGNPASLSFRLQNAKIDGVPEQYKKLLLAHRPVRPPRPFASEGLDLSLWIRMLYSALVDADFLDTEAYMDHGKAEARGRYLSIPDLLVRFDVFMEGKVGAAMQEAPSDVNRARQEVLADCREAAHLEPGFFSLTVPTGGGKTLASLAFGLEHAKRFGKTRIIYVIPYSSIIEQNADVFRSALGTEQIIEHHSNLAEEEASPPARLAAENWDAPLVVTTSVQFFESLFAAMPGKCRKLHNIANSVVILDETQLLPVEYLSPILETMRLLCDHYGTTFVFCTATQPAFERHDSRSSFPGLPAGCIREIIKDVFSLYRRLKRVEVELPKDLRTATSWEDIAKALSGYEQALCVVSDRRSCRELHALMPKGSYHLSALMCPQHRSDTILRIKDGLAAGEIVRVVSTQLVEAGVDFSFPIVYRALAGLDSIAQAAGRCNREGRMNLEGKHGKVVVFVPPRQAPAGILRKATETARGLLEGGLSDPIDHASFAPYFSELYWKANSLDGKGISRMLTPDRTDCGIQFRSAAEAFRIIDEGAQKPILIPYRQGDELLRKLKSIGPERWLLRRLQRYAVNVYTNQFEALLGRGSIKEVSPGIFALVCGIEYDDTVGLKIDDAQYEPGAYIS